MSRTCPYVIGGLNPRICHSTIRRADRELCSEHYKQQQVKVKNQLRKEAAKAEQEMKLLAEAEKEEELRAIPGGVHFCSHMIRGANPRVCGKAISPDKAFCATHNPERARKKVVWTEKMKEQDKKWRENNREAFNLRSREYARKRREAERLAREAAGLPPKRIGRPPKNKETAEESKSSSAESAKN